MGFSVTASTVIIFIAALTVGSVALDTLWDSASSTTNARDRWARTVASEVRTNLTLTVPTCDSNCNPPTVPTVEIDVANTGKTVVDVRNLTFLIDGVAYTFASVVDFDIVSPSAISGTDLILPGETMRVEFNDVPVTEDYDPDDDATNADDLPVMVVTLDGVIGGR